MTDTPRIYVASLSDYNAGTLHGVWIDADQDADSIHEEIRAMLGESPTAASECYYCGKPPTEHGDGEGQEPHGFVPSKAEEWAIHDYDNFGGMQLGEYESIERIAEIGAAIAEHGAGPIGAYLSNDATAELSEFEDRYNGQHDSETAFAQQLAEDLGLVNEDASWPNSYIDWERATDELFMGDYWSSSDSSGMVYVFRSF